MITVGTPNIAVRCAFALPPVALATLACVALLSLRPLGLAGILAQSFMVLVFAGAGFFFASVIWEIQRICFDEKTGTIRYEVRSKFFAHNTRAIPVKAGDEVVVTRSDATGVFGSSRWEISLSSEGKRETIPIRLPASDAEALVDELVRRGKLVDRWQSAVG